MRLNRLREVGRQLLRAAIAERMSSIDSAIVASPTESSTRWTAGSPVVIGFSHVLRPDSAAGARAAVDAL